MELSDEIRLSQLRLFCDSQKFNTETFCNVFRNMPKLAHLLVVIDYSNKFEELLMEVIKVAVLQNKDIVLQDSYYPESSVIENNEKNAASLDTEKQTLEVELIFDYLFEDMKFFVEELVENEKLKKF